ncbi:putative TonB-like protein [Sphingomonas changbaiensis NBRC 104936]|uniref:Protein TonB n=1 Tax=Sphingomonas changbaiensis NBRC 104936 TaxID=1219043 RepID=A0A0E9MMY2_9SPHN|nr:energy transducer TonB [Sphingomonas changbaiensis]GAO38796.1 putative TonB-like protein [Sphingomonas changbaiensis NBRC 104936]
MYAEQRWSKERATSVAGVVLVHALLGYALIAGLRTDIPHRVSEELKLFNVLPVHEPPKPQTKIPHKIKSPRPEGEASPPNLRAEPTQIVLPPPPVKVPTPNPLPVAPIPGVGNAPSAGSADIPGPGYGAGGFGNGRGSGGEGEGDGGGGWVAPRQIKGRIKDSDYPRSAGAAGVGGTVSVRYEVGVDGRVTDCEVTRSSGFPDLDNTTCRLIMERFRFKPSLDPDGHPVSATIVQNHTWVIHQLPPEEEGR